MLLIKSHGAIEELFQRVKSAFAATAQLSSGRAVANVPFAYAGARSDGNSADQVRNA